MSSRRSGGSFRERKTDDILDIEPKDFANPWNFFNLFTRPEVEVQEWCRRNGLLATVFPCPYDGCDGQMSPKTMVRAPGGSIYRCSKNRDHTRASRTYSFFEKSNLLIQDIMLFIKNYLEKCSLSQCARFSGMSYGSTSVNWASFIREIFKEYFYRNLRFKKLHGVIEIDESLFGRRVKFHRGNPNRGLKIWIFGMVERDSNTLIIYPVCDRTEETLLPIIERHVEKGSTIYSDGWSAYCKLNEAGYEHFTVIHKYSFKKTYVNTKTQDIVEVHTNRIEGAWKHAKDHFRKLSGTKITQFEGHLAEIMWRSAEKGNVYRAFFDFLRSVYTLNGPAQYSYSTPLFNTWDGVPLTAANSQFDEWEIRPENTDAESEASSQSDGSLELFSSIPTSRITMENRELSSTELRERQTHEKSSLDKLFDEMIGSCSDEEDKTLTETASRALNTDDERPVNVPDTNQYVRRSGRRKKSLSTGKWNAIVISSDDDSKQPSCTAAKVSTASIASRLRPPKASHESGQYGAQGSTEVADTAGPSSAHESGKAYVKRMRTDKVCHPKDFKEQGTSSSKSSRKQRSRLSNPYGKSAFIWTSDDDDFE